MAVLVAAGVDVIDPVMVAALVNRNDIVDVIAAVDGRARGEFPPWT